jgi:two-component system sensor histidine kinase PilS (NtrC family)
MLNTRYLAEETLERLGSAYAHYRLLLASGLFVMSLVTPYGIFGDANRADFYLVLCMAYLMICCLSTFAFRYYKKALQQQLYLSLNLDVLFLILLLYLSTGPDIVTTLLFVVVVLAANMLLNSKQAFSLTLLSIIAVVYHQFFLSILYSQHNSYLGSSSLITLVFLATHALGQIGVKRLHLVEGIAFSQRSALIQLQHIHQMIIEQLQTGFLVLDAQCKIISFNEAAWTLLSLPIHKSDHQPQLAQIMPDLAVLLQQKSLLRQRGVFEFQPHPAAEKLSIQYQPITSNHQQLRLLIIESLLKIDQQVQQLKLASLGQLSASIAHEIRNPLAAISQANELLHDEVSDTQQLLTQMISRQSQRINHIIEDTLSMSRQNPTQAETIQLYPWLKNFIQEDLSDIKHYILLLIEDKLTISFDPNQLGLVLINLVRNAIRHGHEKTPESQITISAHQYGDSIFVDVIDQGHGVSKQQELNLFEPFYSTATHGTGLGLYLSKALCEANHARLKYIASLEGGCFRIECLANAER